MSDTEKARELLNQAYNLTSEIEVANLIHEAIGLLYRNHYSARTANKSERMSARKVQDIKFLKETHPEMSHQEIANECNVNPGRVTDVLAGKYDHLRAKA